MNRKIYLEISQPADRLVIPKIDVRLLPYHANYLGKDNNGNRVYMGNAIRKGVQIVSEACLFRSAYELTRVERFTTGNQHQRNAVIQFAMQLQKNSMICSTSIVSIMQIRYNTEKPIVNKLVFDLA